MALPVEKIPAVLARGRFADRLPASMQSVKVIALAAEDHYLRVYPADGRLTLILMRLSDAIAELPGDAGAQTHRSWWVAKDAVLNAVKGGGRATLRLLNDTEVPVSRTYYKSLNDEDWFT